ncbi:MAG: hypothetical protein QGG57_06805 [Candidatus Poseidoniia archaeon]|nr:hypothetical protein [Candidatus Poseidoniia archaeon]
MPPIRNSHVIDNESVTLRDKLGEILPSCDELSVAVAYFYLSGFARIAPVLARIGATDALIDQVVYRLYGLSAEEVAVVEGGK